MPVDYPVLNEKEFIGDLGSAKTRLEIHLFRGQPQEFSSGGRFEVHGAKYGAGGFERSGRTAARQIEEYSRVAPARIRESTQTSSPKTLAISWGPPHSAVPQEDGAQKVVRAEK